jgi:hypothetical protein
MRHEKRLDLLDHAMRRPAKPLGVDGNPRRHWRCEWCDCPLPPGDVLCEDCTRDMLDTEMDE